LITQWVVVKAVILVVTHAQEMVCLQKDSKQDPRPSIPIS